MFYMLFLIFKSQVSSLALSAVNLFMLVLYLDFQLLAVVSFRMSAVTLLCAKCNLVFKREYSTDFPISSIPSFSQTL